MTRYAREGRTWTRDHIGPASGHRSSQVSRTAEPPTPADGIQVNIQSLLSVFPRVEVFTACAPCLSAIENCCADPSNSKCCIVLVGIPQGEESSSRQPRRQTRSPSPTSHAHSELSSWEAEDSHGMDFLIFLAYKVRTQNLGSCIIPVVIRDALDAESSIIKTSGSKTVDAEDPLSLVPYFDAGAVDVLTTPISPERVQCLPSHAYRINAERLRRRSSGFLPPHGKKTSWVGTKEGKPYTQIKEVMVCELMDHIVNPDREELPIDPCILSVEASRHEVIANAFGSWAFSAHEFTDDELLYGALSILQHTLRLPGLERFRLSKDELVRFLLATRRVYNSSVLYHNFRHACDVLQATFMFLLLNGSIPSFPSGKPVTTATPTPLGSLIDPFHALILMIAAIGHDVGHPGVNNGFLVLVNAPLAQLYNDRSVLESFHCAAYSQILRRYWKEAFADSVARRLTINTILATDMGLHGDFMMQMNAMHDKAPRDERELDGWSGVDKDRCRELLLCLLIKCADICNVAREFEIASRWAKILIDEFFAQGQIEKDSKIPSALFGGPPDPDSLMQKARSQIGFMNVFAKPLFSGMTKLLPPLGIAVQEITKNTAKWQDTIDNEASAETGEDESRR